MITVLVRRIRDTRKVYLQEFLIPFAIGWGMKYGINIVKQFQWLDGFSQSLFDLLNDLRIEVWNKAFLFLIFKK